MSCAELLEPITTRLLAAVAVGPPGAGCEWCCSPLKRLDARESSACSARPTCRWRAPAARVAASRLAVALDRRPSTPCWPRRSCALRALGGAPVVQLHHLGVHLQPVADLVLGREHRPVSRERQVRQVVVPDRVVQAQRLVALAPGSPGRAFFSTMIVGTPSRRSRAPSAMPPWPPPTITTVGLVRVAELGLGLARARARSCGRVHAVLDALVARSGPSAPRSPSARSCVVSSVQRLAVRQPQVAAAAATAVSKREPASVTPPASRGLALDRAKPRGAVAASVARSSCRDAVVALRGGDVPGEGDQVAPEAVVAEQRRRPVDVPGAPGPPRTLPARRRPARPAGGRWRRPSGSVTRALRTLLPPVVAAVGWGPRRWFPGRGILQQAAPVVLRAWEPAATGPRAARSRGSAPAR